uniref:Uncharacterized protein n=1 Tax=Plectus sambesii TaxID=2011161 RepID=A0A914WQM2_9BILA
MVARTTGLWKTEPCGVENCFVCEMFTSSSGNTTGTMTTTSPITGTTQTPRPTPSNACHTKNCTGTLGYPGNCSFSGNVATCHCPGNLDPDSCGKVGCVKKMNGGQVVNQAGPFWSPGYNGYNGTYGGNLDCYWILSQGGQQVNITLKAFKTASDATLTLRTNSGNYPLSGDLTNILDLINRRLQSAIAVSTPHFCQEQSGKCFTVIVHQKLKWNDAEKYCETTLPNGRLASIHNVFDGSIIVAWLPFLSTDPWFGAFQIGTQPFQYADGSSMDYTNWTPGQPTLQCAQICHSTGNNAGIQCQQGKWRTASCEKSAQFICEYEYSSISPTSTVPYTTVSTTSTAPPSTAVTTLPPDNCPEDMVYDIFIILDDSGNSNTAQFLEMQSFLIQYLSKLTYSPSYTQVLFLSASSTAMATGTLGFYKGPELAQIIQYTYQAVGDYSINLQSAFRVIVDTINEKEYRPSAHHLILYITTTSYTDDPLSLASQLRNQYGQSFLSIAYGSNADVDKLAQLSGGYDCVLRAGIPGVSLDDVVLQAWNKTCSYTSCNESATTTTASSPPHSCDIKSIKYMIYLVVDDSSAVSKIDYDQLRTFLTVFASEYTVAADNVVFALITVSHEATVYLISPSVEDVVYTLINHNKQDGMGQNLNEAFLWVNQLLTLNLVPPGTPQLLIYISGTTEFTESAPYDTADILAQAGIKFLAVQYEQQADLSTLAYLVGGENCVYSATDSDSRNGMAAWLQNKTCNEDYCNIPPSTTTATDRN